MKNRYYKNILFYAVTALLVMVSAFCVAMTAVSQSRAADQKMEAFYREKEKTLVKEVRSFLNEEGFQDSGVALTRMVDGEGQREYTVTVHHDRIDRMDAKSREILRAELAELDFEEEGCFFRHEFLMAD